MDVNNPKELPVPEDMLIEAHETVGINKRQPFFHWSRGIFVLLIIFLLGILLFGGFAFLYIHKRSAPPQVTMNKTTISPSPTEDVSKITMLIPAADTSTWQQFTDPNYGFSFQYPQDWQLDVGGKFPDTSWTFPLPKLNELINTSTWTNPRYTIDFAIPNPAFPQDKLGIGVELLNNEQNITLGKFLDEYLGDDKNTWRITHLTLKGFPAAEISGPDDPTTKDSNVNSQVYIFVPSPDQKTSYVYNLRFMLNGEGTSRVYTINDPFVQKELQLFNGFVNSFSVAKQTSTANWKTFDGKLVSFKYPSDWYPKEQDLSMGAVLESINLGIPNQSNNIVGNSFAEFSGIQPKEFKSSIMGRNVVDVETYKFNQGVPYTDYEFFVKNKYSYLFVVNVDVYHEDNQTKAELEQLVSSLIFK